MSTVLTLSEMRALANLSRAESEQVTGAFIMKSEDIQPIRKHKPKSAEQYDAMRAYLQSVYRFRRDGDTLKVFTNSYFHEINANDELDFINTLERKFNADQNDLSPIFKKI